MVTLEEALANGRGIERPFCCPEHDDSNASASVNVVKKLWFCYACGAWGTAKGATGAKAEFARIVKEMVTQPEQTRFPETWLDWFNPIESVYWAKRFHPAVVRYFSLGTHPELGHPTIPVRYADGALAGVMTRSDGIPKYMYPPGWSASATVFRTGLSPDLLVIVEGPSDAIELAECGITSVALFGSHIHGRQVDLLKRHRWKEVVIATDNDDAGEAGAVQIAKAFPEALRFHWPEGNKDGGSLRPGVRWEWWIEWFRLKGPVIRMLHTNRAWWQEQYKNHAVMDPQLVYGQENA